jgi:hypothetical protein
MTEALNVFRDQSAGYEQYVLEHWYELEDWEREQYSRFASWAGDKKKVRRFITGPVDMRSARPKFAGESVLGPSHLPRLISFTYALALVGIVFFPFMFEAAAVLLAIVNMICRRWDHALLQIGIAACVLVLAALGTSASDSVMPLMRTAFQ